MGATLEQFALTQEDYGGLEGVHSSMLDAGAEVVETDSFQGSRLKLDEWGLGEEHTLEINTRAAQVARKGRGRESLRIPLDQGRRYSWGYPACPDQSEHEKIWRLLELERIGMTLSDGYAVMPEQSTVAIVAHHPQAVYFGMKSGLIPEVRPPTS
jgi:hypothetical protein